jgi:hypothetical protein
MSKTPPAKGRADRPEPPVSPRKRLNPLLVVAVVVVALAAGAAFWRGASQAPAASAAAPPAADPANPAQPAKPNEDPRVKAAAEEAAKAMASIGPHKQATLPPIPFRGYAPPRAPEVVAAAFDFAAEHPEVLAYVPCFCGCEMGGHRGNEDCFVKRRDASGDFVEWEEHGLECLVCIDVATRSRQMYASGASVADIRAAIDKEFGARYTTNKTPTPLPPHSH